MNIIKPPLLKYGDTIGILATSGAMEDDKNLHRAINFFENKGYRVKLSDNIYSQTDTLQAQTKKDLMHCIKCSLTKKLMQLSASEADMAQ